MKQRRLISLYRVVLGGVHNFVRNAWLSIAAIAVMLITLSIVLFSVIANATFSNTIQQIRDRIDISVYLNDDVTQRQREELIADLGGIDNVKSVTYISKEQALADYKVQNADNIDLQLAISQTDNPLPASLQIKMHDTDRIEEIREFLEKPEVRELQSDETSYSGDRKEAIDKITQATTFIRRAGIVSVVIFAFISMLIIFNTIQMAIFNRRDELNIMRLLGAATWYIRGPFLVETIIYGIISALVSVALCNALFSVASSTLNASSFGLLDITFASRYFSDHFLLILAAQLALGVFIGVMSSYIATHRYLKFKTK